MFTKLTDSNLVDLKVGTVIREIGGAITRTVDSVHDKGLIATGSNGRSRKFTWSQLVFLYEMEGEVPKQPVVGKQARAEQAEQRAAKGEHVVAGPASFWDVRQAETFIDRQAYTTHNVYIANTMAGNEGWMLTAQIATLIQERDTLVYTRGGYEGSHGADATDQYLAGRIAGIEYALAQFGVRGF